MNVQGIDCSHWNGVIDWPKLAADGVQFAYIKAWQGGAADPKYTVNLAGCTAAGIFPMAYVFLTVDDTAEDVSACVAFIGKTIPVVLDWETEGVSNAVPDLWFTDMPNRNLLYCGIDPPDEYTPTLARMPRILPEYASAPRLPAWDGVSVPDWSKEWLIWQSNGHARFAGETGGFDLDQLAISLDRLKAWCAGGTF